MFRSTAQASDGGRPWRSVRGRPHHQHGRTRVQSEVPMRKARSERHELWENPMGTDGFEFVEYTGPDPQALAALFERMGFVAAARHRSKNVTLYKQGDV